MWLVYLRFDDSNETKTYHVTAGNKVEVDKLLALARKRGVSTKSKLVEYAVFYARSTIKPKHVPNFHFYKNIEAIYDKEEVKEAGLLDSSGFNQQLLAQHQANLNKLKLQAAKYGIDVPLRLQNEIEAEEEEITRLKGELGYE